MRFVLWTRPGMPGVNNSRNVILRARVDVIMVSRAEGAPRVVNITKIEIEVPAELLEAVEVQSRARDETVSQFFCRGAETLLRRHRERRMLEEYVQAREKMPDQTEVDEALRALEDPGTGATESES